MKLSLWIVSEEGGQCKSTKDRR